MWPAELFMVGGNSDSPIVLASHKLYHQKLQTTVVDLKQLHLHEDQIDSVKLQP